MLRFQTIFFVGSAEDHPNPYTYLPIPIVGFLRVSAAELETNQVQHFFHHEIQRLIVAMFAVNLLQFELFHDSLNGTNIQKRARQAMLPL